MEKIIVVGGGAAGMMAAMAAADRGKQVLLLEKNEKLGKKIFITGKGRCNVTNAGDMDALFASVMSNEKFLYSAFYQFDNRAVMDFFEREGCPLKVERGDRVFPVSDHSSDVIAALQRALKKRSVEVRLNTEVLELLTEQTDSGVAQIRGVRLRNGQVLYAEAVIIATGGISYPSTGSTGDGYRFAQETGHRMVEPMPSLVPLKTKEEWGHELMGLSLKNVTVTMKSDDKELYQGFGEMLFTHFGLSGPLILSASSFYVKALRQYRDKLDKRNAKVKKNTKAALNQNAENAVGKADSGNGKTAQAAKNALQQNIKTAQAVKNESQQNGMDCHIYIDLKPALTKEQLDKRILRDFDENKNKQFKNTLNGLFPAKLIPVMITLSGIDPDKKVHEITREERQSFVDLIKALPLTVTGTGEYKEAIITKGGIQVKDINPSTMESKKVQGLYFAGEVLDVDAVTGGFNLQIAWSTGYLAGSSAGEADLFQEQ